MNRHQTALGALRKEWLRALPREYGWQHFSPHGRDDGVEMTFKAGRRHAHCPSCGRLHRNVKGQFIICCGLRIYPPWLVREFKFNPSDLGPDPIGALREAATRNARCSGGQVTLEPPPIIQEEEPPWPA